MKKISVQEQYALFKSTLNLCGTFLLRCNDDDIEYNIFEEFDGDSISFLSECLLNSLLSAKYITEEIRFMAIKLAKDFRKFENTDLWNVEAVRNSQEWLSLLSLADEIKDKLQIYEKNNRISEIIMDEVTLFNCFKYKRNWLLIEMVLNVSSNEICWDKFIIPESGVSEADWQVSYLEQYLSENGTEKICELYDEPQTPVKPCRIAFFIYKTGDVLRTPYGDFSVSHTDKMPKRLKRIVKFEKPD